MKPTTLIEKSLMAYLAFEGFTQELINEVTPVVAVHDRLVIVEGPRLPPVWAKNCWENPVYLSITSISNAVRQLKQLQLRWVPYAFHLHRRTELIQQQLSSIKTPTLDFFGPIPTKSLGSWTLLDENLILASSQCSSPFPNGDIIFQENKVDPPSRAYLKLWELFTIYGVKPLPKQVCLDLGSSPGGWTWVLQQLDCTVISVDKAPLDPRLLKLPGIRYLNQSAFSLSPQAIGHVDWLFSDVICYPRRLLTLVKAWIKAELCNNFVCTLKLQDDTDSAVLKEFSAIEGSRLVHLCHNKHELTWFKIQND